ncbi:hypothetical protein CTZ27_09750 [Streptomyces griseocarneus]|nr:hypothetical protein CTZ27_09750 [Streptomyces griseocarneus]
MSNETLEQGMENLRTKLPGAGWKILKDGKSESADQDPEILAENKQDRYAAHFTWVKGKPDGQSMITVSVVSACFQAPAGTDLRREF